VTPNPDAALLPLVEDPERISFFKRFKMERDLDRLPPPALPPDYHWVAWDRSLVDAHARTLYECFRGEIDGALFRSFRTPHGCEALLSEISRRPGFLPAATWLVGCADGLVGTVQGICDRGVGGVQNVGVAAAHRGRGLGTALVWQALHGFRAAGMGRAVLEVTAENAGAVRLYQRLGFRRRKTLYKLVADREKEQ
jgi:ribosomal protein S18 acetylase RimI-like enzyme